MSDDRQTANPLSSLYPELRAGGFTRVDGTIGFYVRVNALLTEIGEDATVVDFGAGRGAFLDDRVAYRRDLHDFAPRVGTLIGIDVDPVVLQNPALHKAYVVSPEEPIPLADQSVDLVVSDFTFEHVTDPAWVANELGRVLRPGGWICARTPNRWGYIGLGARIVPNRLHVPFLHRLQPTKQERDTFPVAYRLNTPGDLARWFPSERFEHVVFSVDSEPAYVGRSTVAARINVVASALTPPALRSVLFAFLRLRSPAADEG